MKTEERTARADKIAKYTLGVASCLVIIACGYSAWDSWATLRLKSHGIQTTATVVQKAERRRQMGTLVTFATLSYRNGESQRQVEVELPRGVGNGLELGQEIQIFYDKSHPLRVLHPWVFVIEEHLSRAIIGILAAGFIWLRHHPAYRKPQVPSAAARPIGSKIIYSMA